MCQKKGAWRLKGKHICEELCFNKLYIYFNKLTKILFKKVTRHGTRSPGYLRYCFHYTLTINGSP